MRRLALAVTPALIAVLATSAQAQGVGLLGMIGAGGDNDALVKISTVTASSSATIQFTGLSATYNTYYLACQGLLLGADDPMRLYVGQGAGPTWKTAATYTKQILEKYVTGGALGLSDNSTTYNGMLTNNGGGSSSIPRSLGLFIDTPSSTTRAKQITEVTSVFITNSTVFSFEMGAGYWNPDTVAITGIQLMPDPGVSTTITSGTCTLYGLAK